MDRLLSLAQNVNMAYNTKNQKVFSESAMLLFNHVQRNASLLTKIDDSGKLQMVGKAFSYNARFLKYEDVDINSVSAENAFYCLAKSIKLDNYFAAPELYNLLKHNHTLLIDRFIPAFIYICALDLDRRVYPDAENLVIEANGGYKGKAMIKSAEWCISYVRFFVISQFYDIESNKSKMPDDSFFIKEFSDTEVTSDINELLQKKSYNEIMKIGKEHFDFIVEDMEKILLKY